jgi:tRNA A-37 threonylcarbamoyl transferase component Bud32
MRKIKKFIRNIKRYYQHSDRIENIQNEIKKELGEVEFKFASFGGADINYYVLKDNNKFGMMRLAIVNEEDDSSLPIVRFNKKKRLTKEYTAYTVGAKYELTPKVIYHSDDALVCKYLKGKRVFDILQKDKSKVWSILSRAVETYKALHSLNIVHLDATLKNFVMEDSQMKVIDFEYYAGKEDFTLAEQKAYDYVRIIEHTLRKIPNEYQKEYHEFIGYLDKIVPKEIRNVDFQYVKPLITNIRNYPIYLELKEKIFTKLTFD